MKQRHIKKLYKKLESLVYEILVFRAGWNVLKNKEQWYLSWLDWAPVEGTETAQMKNYMIHGAPKDRCEMLKMAIRDAENEYVDVGNMDIDITSAEETHNA